MSSEEFFIDDVADSVHAWLKSLEISNCIIIGHSLGGYVALSLIERYPSLCHSFGLLHSTAFSDPPEKKDSRNRLIEFVQKYGIELFARSFVPALFFQPEEYGLSKTVEEITNMVAATPLATVIAYTKAMRDRPNRIEVLSNTQKQVLFIAGEKDTSVPLEKSKEQAYLPIHHHVFFLDNTGHMGMFERQNEVAQIIENFLAACLDIEVNY